jgi:putative transposase
LREFIPEPKPGPQEVKYERREIVNAILYQKRTGCQWRYLPHDFPPWQLVAAYYYQWQLQGLFERMVRTLHERVRVSRGGEKTASLGIVDSQSVKTTEVGRPKGFDPGKKVKGRKRHILVDVLGLLVVAAIAVAGVQDRDALPSPLRAGSAVSKRLQSVLVDGPYTGDVVAEAWVSTSSQRDAWTPARMRQGQK